MERDTSCIVCPYDSNHVIDKARFQRHIVKCRKNFPSNYMETCPFNARHIMISTEMIDHIDTCPDKRFVEPEKYCVLKNHGSLRYCPPSHTELTLTHDGDESWEERLYDFNDASTVVSEALSGSPDSSPKSERKTLGSKKVRARAPRTRALAMMVDASDDSAVEDMESVTSSLTVGGRGRKILTDSQIKSTLMRGRGRGSFM